MEKSTESVEHGGGKDGEGPSLGGAPRKGDDLLLVELLALGTTHHQAGSELGISARTVARRRREPDIARAIRERRGDVVSEVAGQLTGLARQAMAVLADELGSDDARIRMSASMAVLDRVTKFCAAAMTQEALERQEDDEVLQARPVAPDSWPRWVFGDGADAGRCVGRPLGCCPRRHRGAAVDVGRHPCDDRR